ncbi:Glucuronosyltransferase [Aphelenchoides besseyi]|nr:Glucuronosyltransferase [Aphelenchoides besseyi]
MFRVLVFSLLFNSIYGLKILFYQVAFGHSHVFFSGRLADELIDRNHVVDQVFAMWTPDLKTNGTERFRRVYRIENSQSPYLQSVHMNDPFGPKADYLPIFQQSQRLFCTQLLSDSRLLNELQNEKYDIGLSTGYDNCGLALFHLIGIKSTAIYVPTPPAIGHLESHGIPSLPSFQTDVIFPIALGTKFTFFERFLNTIDYLKRTYRLHQMIKLETKLIQRLHPNLPSMDELLMNLAFVFVNVDPILDHPRVFSNKIKFIGGIHLSEKRNKDLQLPDEYRSLLDNSLPDGVVVFSLGSVVKMKSTPEHIRHSFFEALGELQNHTIIWKHEDPEIDNEIAQLYPNIHLKRLNSYMETARSGKPVVALPLIIDQQHNAGAAVEKGLGVMINKENITVDSIREAVGEVLKNPNYIETARLIARMLRSQPQNPNLDFVRNVEFAAEFPSWSKLMQLESGWQNFAVRHSLDVISVFLIFFLSILFLTLKYFRSYQSL